MRDLKEIDEFLDSQARIASQRSRSPLREFPVVGHGETPQDEGGICVAACPSLPGCVSQRATRSETQANIREAIEHHSFRPSHRPVGIGSPVRPIWPTRTETAPPSSAGRQVP
jgi:hypothetical protein